MWSRFSKFEACGAASPQRLYVHDRLGVPVREVPQAPAKSTQGAYSLLGGIPYSTLSLPSLYSGA